MQAQKHQITQLSMQKITSCQAHELHKVKLIMPALCRVRQGKKIIEWQDHVETADPTQLIIFPAGYELKIANLPANGHYLSEIIYIPPSILQLFQQSYPSSINRERKSGFCLSLNDELIYCWEQLKYVLDNKFSLPLLEHMVLGLLLMLKGHNISNILFSSQDSSLITRCQEILMLAPERHWTASQVAEKLHMSTSTFHRHLAAEGGRFQQIIDDVRLGSALNAIQLTKKPISEIARENGYHCPSRFTARFQKRYQITPRALRQTVHVTEMIVHD
ncbi:MAG: helix-turn-helix transcriptional regulator [Plesiomonas sp.]|uniref:helix-turn-helix transcriptional regulator n=1 Tax=Plesiomonas sp. TaxID=2486279 RepID=UPI003F2EBF04